jgi:nucleoside-triphosphatase THEP1
MSMNIITGEIGSGKTTVCQHIEGLARQAHLVCGGILSCKMPDGTIEFKDLLTGKSEILASTRENYPGPQLGKFSFSPRGIEFGLRAVQAGITCDLLFVDELGPLELSQAGLWGAIKLLDSAKIANSIVVIRKKSLCDFLPLFGSRPLIFEVTDSNRGDLPALVFSNLKPDHKVKRPTRTQEGSKGWSRKPQDAV